MYKSIYQDCRISNFEIKHNFDLGAYLDGNEPYSVDEIQLISKKSPYITIWVNKAAISRLIFGTEEEEQDAKL